MTQEPSELTSKRGYRAPAVDRAFVVLRRLAEDRDGLPLSELARTTGIPASTLLGLLGSLQAADAVRLTSARRYVLDVGLMALGQAYVDKNDIVESFRPIGKRLVKQYDETVHMGVLVGADAVYIARQSSSQPLRMVAALGRRVPAYASAVGKAILAYRADVDLRELLPADAFQRFTATTIFDRDRLIDDLDGIRVRGFSESNAECIEGLQCVAASVFDHTGTAVAAIGVSVPELRMTAQLRARLESAIVDAGRELSTALGFRDRPVCDLAERSGDAS